MRRVALLLGLAGCIYDLPGAPEVDTAPSTVRVTEVFDLSVEDARLPSDLQPLPDGGFVVLDGYRGRALLFDEAQQPTGTIGSPAVWGNPVRIAPFEGDFWLTAPDEHRVLRVDATGELELSLTIVHEGQRMSPVTVLPKGDQLVVGTREGPILWVDAGDGAVRDVVAGDHDGGRIGAITDIVENGGTLVGTDALASWLVKFDHQGVQDVFGNYGLWEGHLHKPKSLASAPGGVLVADSALGAVQLFGLDGVALGMLATEDGPVRFEHPLAVRHLGGDRYAVLDQASARVWGFSLSVEQARAARAASGRVHLRYSLLESFDTVSGPNGELCVQCHDGLVNDDRYVWDSKLDHHPVNTVPDRELPSFYPLGEDGSLECITCHSPHGFNTVDEVLNTTAENLSELSRHGDSFEMFTRMTRRDSALCVSCHTEAAHEKALMGLGFEGGGHPSGQELLDKLAERDAKLPGEASLPDGLRSGCLGCHAVHGAQAGGLQRDTNGKVCAKCHPDQAEIGENHPLASPSRHQKTIPPRPEAMLPVSTKGGPSCRSCHDLVSNASSLLRAPRDGGALCLACHESYPKLEGGHARVEGEHGLACLACHDPHLGRADARLLKTKKAGNGADPLGCLSCHAPEGMAAKRGVRPARMGHPVGGDAVHEGEVLVCATCHAAPHAPKDTPECGACHADQNAAGERGGHGSATCADCHPPHSPPPWAGTAASTDVNPRSRKCLACHGPTAKGPAQKRVSEYEHPAPNFTPDGQRWTPLGRLPLFDDAGRLVPAGRNGNLTCSSCHETHGPNAAKAGDNLRIPEWKAACTACHGDDALVFYRYFHRPDRRGGTP